jgi:tRNA A-37 threonylcarbamoyl transferase component Bud32
MTVRLPKGFSHPMRIGEGAFSSVYRVRQNALDRWVAIKMLREKDPKKKRDLLKEATTQARIRAECIPQVYHVFEWRQQVCIVMEWIKGVSLTQILGHGPTPVQRLWLCDAFIRSLSSLHGLGFAHRDLKPDNILVSPTRGVMLVDFGFTKSVTDGQQSVSGVVKGTPAYMAPELWSHTAHVDPMRCDVFAAGRVLRDIMDDDSDIPFVKKCLDEDPSRRPASCREILAEWARLRPAMVHADWRGLSQTHSSHHVSSKLVPAARLLLRQGRQDEAYWLCVEAIEENPNNAEAVGLMNSFPKHAQRRRQRRRITYAAAAALCAFLLLVAFVIGRRSRAWEGAGRVEAAVQAAERADRSALLSTALSPAPDAASMPLRDDSSAARALSGTLFIAAHPVSGALSIDGELHERLIDLNKGIAVSAGNHLLSWIDGNGNVLWRERIALLPFATKIITVAAAQRK